MVEILFEDNHLLCLAKPAGLATQVSPDNTDSLETQAKAYIKRTYNKPGNVYLHAVHRLDKPTSGIVVFAKTSKALSRMNELMRQGGLEKTYRATVEGIVSTESGMLEHYLVHGDHKAYVSTKNDTLAKRCVLHFQVISRSENSSELEIRLETGRYHQIRAQLQAIGHPIVGDRMYGAKKNWYHPDAIALHHSRLLFCHPVTGQQIEINKANLESMLK